MLNEHDHAPDFSLPDNAAGTVRSLSDFKGKYVLIYFYPKDDTPGCTKEACGIRDAYDEYGKRGIVILGVSRDSVESHKKFKEKYGLPFTLLSDTEGKMIAAYGAAKSETSTARISYLIGPDGTVIKAYPNVTPADHGLQIITDFDALAHE